MKIGYISNPRSHGNRNGRGIARHIEPTDSICVAKPVDHNQLVEELLRFGQNGVELIVIDGGDGTVRDIVSNVHHAYSDEWPTFALMPSGKTNVIAGEVGHFGAGMKGWRRLLEERAEGRLTDKRKSRTALEVSWPGRTDPLQRGFLFGCAAFSDGVRLANESLHPIGIAQGLAVSMAIGGVLRKSLMNKLKNVESTGEPGTVHVDGVRINQDHHFLVLASTLERLTLGIKPFWDQGSGPINWLDIAAPLKRPVRGTVLMAMGKRRRWMEQNGYASGRAASLDVNIERPFVLDGEMYEPQGKVRISASRPIGFVSQ